MRKRARTDANHAEIREALRRDGWYVLDTSSLGGGFPDLVAAKGGSVHLIEVKDGSKPLSAQALTSAEAKVSADLLSRGVVVKLIRNVDEAMAL